MNQVKNLSALGIISAALLPALALYVYRPVKGVFTHPRSIAHQIVNVVKYRSPKKRL